MELEVCRGTCFIWRTSVAEGTKIARFLSSHPESTDLVIPQTHTSLVTMDKVSLETTCIGIVGLLGLNLTLKALSHLYKTFLRPGKDLKKLGKWAVVTGATGMSRVLFV